MDKVPTSLKFLLFGGLTFITTANIVCMNLSRTKKKGEPMYYASTTVFCAELLKIFISLLFLLVDQKDINAYFRVLKVEIVEKWQETLKLSIPAFVYVIQNNLGFFALSKLDPATYQVTYQVKLLTTAVVMRVMLGKVLNVTQWTGLFVLLFGVCLVEVEKLSISEQAKPATGSHGKPGAVNKHGKVASGEEPSYFSFDVISGILATLGMTFCSAIAGVYFEKVVKTPSTSNGISSLSMLWIRNIQLYIFSCASALITCILTDGSNISTNGFFYGYTPLVCWVIVILSAGGTATALMLKYLDNIYKNFASSMSIVFASLCAFFLTGENYGLKFFIGSILVCSSLFIYQSAAISKPAAKPHGSTTNKKELPMYYPSRIASSA